MLRLVVIFVLFYLLLSVLKGIIFRGKGSTPSREKSQPQSEEMVLDPQCQSYIPKSSAIVQSGKHFCSQECARLYLSR
jgi:uncharacterized protein